MSHNRHHPRHERVVPDCRSAHGRDRCHYDAVTVLGNDPMRARPADRRRMASMVDALKIFEFAR